MKKQLIWIAILVVIVGVVFFSVGRTEAPVVPGQEIEETDNGGVEVGGEDEDIEDDGSQEVVTGGCYVGGCSSQICSDTPDAISTCEFREEYACYQTAKCERQTSGQCGWTETAELRMCLNAAN